jgi:hypothetical protein
MIQLDWRVFIFPVTIHAEDNSNFTPNDRTEAKTSFDVGLCGRQSVNTMDREACGLAPFPGNNSIVVEVLCLFEIANRVFQIRGIALPFVPGTQQWRPVAPEFARTMAPVGGPTCFQSAAARNHSTESETSPYLFPAPLFLLRFFAARSSMTACAAANRAIGTRNGDALT